RFRRRHIAGSPLGQSDTKALAHRTWCRRALAVNVRRRHYAPAPGVTVGRGANALGSLPATNACVRDALPGAAFNPVALSIFTSRTLSGTLNSRSGRPSSARCMKAVQIGVAARPPVYLPSD